MEAITREKEVFEMSKTLAKEFGLLRADKAGPVYTLRGDLSAEGWEELAPGTYANRKYFDLAGLAMEEKTLFFEGAVIQDTWNPVNTPATAGNLASVLDVMSNKPLSNSDCIAAVNGLGNTVSPVGAKLTFDQTIYMRLRVFVVDLDTQAGGYFITLSDNQLGSLSPTASDRVYCTRVVLFGNNADGVYSVYPVRYLLRANAKEEAEFEYLMRLKRSYELQQEPDVD